MSAEKNLRTISAALARMTRASITGGFGPTFVDEIKQLDRAVAEIKRLRNGGTMGAKVIEAGEHDRRELLVRVAVLTRSLQLSHDCWHAMRKHNNAACTAAENCLDESERWDIERALDGASDYAGSVVLSAGQVTRIKQITAAAVSTEFADQIADILDGKAGS